MLLSTAKDIAAFLEELRRESDRGLPLVAVALIDDLLKETLRSFFVDGSPSAKKVLDEGNSPLGTLSSRVEACRALGLIDEFEFAEIHLLRKIRNEFAHAKHGMSYADDKVRSLCFALKSDIPRDDAIPEDVDTPRFRVMNAALKIVLHLYHRPDWVAFERRKPKEWVSDDQTRWRSWKETPPPGIAPVIAFGGNSIGILKPKTDSED